MTKAAAEALSKEAAEGNTVIRHTSAGDSPLQLINFCPQPAYLVLLHLHNEDKTSTNGNMCKPSINVARLETDAPLIKRLK